MPPASSTKSFVAMRRHRTRGGVCASQRGTAGRGAEQQRGDGAHLGKTLSSVFPFRHNPPRWTKPISLRNNKAPRDAVRARPAARFSCAKSAGLCGAGGYSGFHGLNQPLTVAGPRPILTAFPTSLACKFGNSVYAEGPGVSRRGTSAACRVRSTVLPIRFALFDESAKPLLRILEPI